MVSGLEVDLIESQCNRNSQLQLNHNGFTLVELLVVIVVIDLLVTLLLPALGTVRKSAHRSECASQLRQTGIAMHAFSEVH
jgi:prepilin-type N-terminal cleavage/methylation domain-containing protein